MNDILHYEMDQMIAFIKFIKRVKESTVHVAHSFCLLKKSKILQENKQNCI